MDAAVADRDATAQRAASIETELEQVRKRLADVEPAEHTQAEEIRELAREREALQEQARRARGPGGGAARARPRAASSWSRSTARSRTCWRRRSRTSARRTARSRSSRTGCSAPQGRGAPARGGGSARWEQLDRRLRTLYKNLEFDDRAIDDLIALGDESLKLQAEEAIKRLADGSDTAAIRRKVGGLPAQLSIFELGFAGKGRIYYTRGDSAASGSSRSAARPRRTQDLEYLSRPAGLSARRSVSFSSASSQGFVITARTPTARSCASGISSVQPVISMRTACGPPARGSTSNWRPVMPGIR